MQILESHTVPNQKTAIRLQEYAVGIFKTISTKSALKKAIKKNLILVDSQIAPTSKFISGGEKIEVIASEWQNSKKQFICKLNVVYEDQHLAVIEKPAGILVSGNTFKTIDNALVQNLTISGLPDAVRPRPVHRLDYPTTGLLLVGKTSSSILALNKLFEKKEVQKTYYAITIGAMKSGETITAFVDEKEAISSYKVLQSVESKRFGNLNLVKLSPKTGRKHQLRKHVSSIGNPILGDKEYGIEGQILKGKGLYLHASKLEFIHPFTKEQMIIKSKLPKKFIKIFPNLASQ